MPWLETSPVEQRERFIDDQHRGLYTMTELCVRYAISRKTGYKWVDRFDDAGRPGLRDRSRAPHHCPHAISDEIARPGDLLARKGLVKKRRRRRHYHHPGVVPVATTQPNDLWTADFKGHFRTRDGRYCYPLTIADLHTRFLLACDGLLSTKGQGVRPVFDRLFREYGLPRAIRTDNGVPFATTGIHGLSQLNVWWIRLGIQHQRILPAHPQQNGAHERMHKTLKGEAIRPPRAHLAAQQRKFNRFRHEYNEERPHQTLRGRTPASLYHPSPRMYTGGLPPIEDPGHFIVKRVTNAGTIRFKKRLLFIPNALKQHQVGLEEVDDGIWSLHFCHVLLGRIDERDSIPSSLSG